MWKEIRVPGENLRRCSRTCKFHTDSGPGWNQIFFSNKYYNEMVLNATVLFGDLLYLESLSWLPDFR